MSTSSRGPFAFDAIGFVRSSLREKADAPRQARAAKDVQGRVELLPEFVDGLRDLDAFDHIWLVTVFDQADGWRSTVLPPRSEVRRGVFATRAPRRPNPIGLSVVRLERVEGATLHIRELDMLDGTPVLDIKPYVAWSDAIPDASSGWLSRPADPGRSYQVEFSELADAQLGWLAEHGEDLRARVARQLEVGPQPHAYRRIRKSGDGFVMAVRKWRVHFRVEGSRVQVDTQCPYNGQSVRCKEKAKVAAGASASLFDVGCSPFGGGSPLQRVQPATQPHCLTSVARLPAAVPLRENFYGFFVLLFGFGSFPSFSFLSSYLSSSCS